MANGVAINQSPFNWEGTDNRGNKVRGKTVACLLYTSRCV